MPLCSLHKLICPHSRCYDALAQANNRLRPLTRSVARKMLKLLFAPSHTPLQTEDLLLCLEFRGLATLQAPASNITLVAIQNILAVSS
jgi:hypothetical protein